MIRRFRWRVFLPAVFAALLTALPAGGQESKDDRAGSGAIDAALAKVSPSLVRIHVVAFGYASGRELKREASGSGTIITPEGHVITNHHVAGRTRSIVCTLPNREEIPADLIGTDPLSDIAVLKLRPARPRVFPAARFGDASRLKVGDRVLALGSPLALSQSVTMGIVSNTEMIMPGMFWPFNRMTLDGEDVGSIVRWIGHDAAIFGGNSGGPLVNMDGEIVGVNEISMGLAGAIPSDLAREVSTAIIRDGTVRRSWIGLDVQPLLKSSTSPRGALVAGTVEGSPAARAGFAAGDVLVKLAGRDIDVRFGEELPLFNQFVMRLPRGQPVAATVLRGGAERTLSVVPQERESAEARVRELPALGITVTDLTSWSAKELRRPDRSGVRVDGIRPGGPAAEAKPSLSDDDVIVAIDGQAVANVEELMAHAVRLTEGRNAPAPSAVKGPVRTLLTFERRSERLLTVLEVGRGELLDPGLEARKAWVPVSVQVLTRELATALGLAGRSGVRVTRVLAGGAATGLEVGDIITAVDGTPVQASQSSDSDLFATTIRQYRIGSTVSLSVLRGGKERAIPVALDASPRLPREMKKYEDTDFEFRVRDIAVADRAAVGLPEDRSGVLVEAVREGGWAALGHLADGDVVLEIDGDPMPDVAAVQEKMQRIARTKPASVVLRVRRGIRTFFVEMQTGQ